MQANLWLKQKHRGKDDLKIIKPNMSQQVITQVLTGAVSYGYPVILEDATETFDPLLEPILAKQLQKDGKEIRIRIGEKNLNYDEAFQFYVTTKMDSPHYSPEICVKMSILNFMVTQEGLMD